MNNELENRRRKSYEQLRMVKDLTMSALILGMCVILLFGDRFGLPIIEDLDKVMRYGLGGLFFVYGCFRAYRAIKHDY